VSGFLSPPLCSATVCLCRRKVFFGKSNKRGGAAEYEWMRMPMPCYCVRMWNKRFKIFMLRVILVILLILVCLLFVCCTRCCLARSCAKVIKEEAETISCFLCLCIFYYTILVFILDCLLSIHEIDLLACCLPLMLRDCIFRL
jgi:hypothetical protein